MSIDLDAIEDRHIAVIEVLGNSPQAMHQPLLASAADVSDLIAEVRRLQPIARKYERLMETHTLVQGNSLG